MTSQTGCPQKCSIWSAHFLHFKKCVAHIQRSGNFSEESSILGFLFKTRSSGHTVWHSHRARSARVREGLLSADGQGTHCPHHPTLSCPRLETFESVIPAPKQWFLLKGFIRIIREDSSSSPTSIPYV